MGSRSWNLDDLEKKGFVADGEGNFVKLRMTPQDKLDLITTGMVKPIEYISKNDVKIKKTSRPKASIPKPDPEGLQALKRVLVASGIKYETEYRFDEERRFRFDIAIVDKMIAIEYEGLMSEKSRHTTIKGYNNDTIKYNLAIIRGWKVLRYTTISYKNFVEDIKHFL